MKPSRPGYFGFAALGLRVWGLRVKVLGWRGLGFRGLRYEGFGLWGEGVGIGCRVLGLQVHPDVLPHYSLRLPKLP